jgi:hypothetical protein
MSWQRSSLKKTRKIAASSLLVGVCYPPIKQKMVSCIGVILETKIGLKIIEEKIPSVVSNQ